MNRISCIFVYSFLLCLGTTLVGQIRTAADKQRIMALIRNLSNHANDPSALLDPQIVGEKRANALKYIGDKPFELSITPTKDIENRPDGTAVLPARVRFKNPTDELDSDAELHFVRRGDNWYFANFDFLGWPAILIVVVIVMPLLGLFYAVGTLVVLNRLRNDGRLWGANLLKVFIPAYWPSLYRERATLAVQIDLLKEVDSGNLDNLQCPQCRHRALSTWFTNPGPEAYRTWLVCAECDFWCHSINSAKPSSFSESRVRSDLQEKDTAILRALRTRKE